MSPHIAQVFFIVVIMLFMEIIKLMIHALFISIFVCLTIISLFLNSLNNCLPYLL